MKEYKHQPFITIVHNVFTWATAEITDGKSNKGSRKILNKEIDVKTLVAVKTFSLSRWKKTPNVANDTLYINK